MRGQVSLNTDKVTSLALVDKNNVALKTLDLSTPTLLRIFGKIREEEKIAVLRQTVASACYWLICGEKGT
jgi:hypothetical protein